MNAMDEDDHPDRHSEHVTPEYLRHLLHLQTERLFQMVTAEFAQALTDLIAAAKASATADQTAIDAAVTASQAEDLAAVEAAKSALAPPAQ
jgi:hypothetical protein